MRLIDADALKKVFHAEWDGVLVWDEGGETTADEFCNLVDNAPTIEAEPVKHGRWTKIGHIEHTWLVSECSECGNQTIDAGSYCPNCGAKMEDKTRNNKRDTFSK